MERGRAQREVDEARAGDLDLFEFVRVCDLFDDGCREVARTAARRLREPHGDVGCEVPVRGIAGALDRAFSRKVSRRVGEVGQAGNGVVEEFCYRGFH